MTWVHVDGGNLTILCENPKRSEKEYRLTLSGVNDTLTRRFDSIIRSTNDSSKLYKYIMFHCVREARFVAHNYWFKNKAWTGIKDTTYVAH